MEKKKVEQHWTRLRVHSTTRRVCRAGPGPAAPATCACSLRGWRPCGLGESTELGVTIMPLASLQASVPLLLHELTEAVDSTPGPGSMISSGTHPTRSTPKHMPAPTDASVRVLFQSSKLIRLLQTEVKRLSLRRPPAFLFSLPSCARYFQQWVLGMEPGPVGTLVPHLLPVIRPTAVRVRSPHMLSPCWLPRR